MKVLITGGTGFIGKNAAEQLSTRHEIVAPTRSELELASAGAVREFVKNAGFDAILHCGSRPTHRASGAGNEAAFENLQMFSNLMRAASAEGIGRFINIGSGSEYDMSQDIVQADERDFGKRIPADVTGYTKYVINFLSEPGVEFVNLRCFGVFGKYEDYTLRFISNAICRALLGYAITLRQDRIFSYIYIDDLIGIVDYFLKNKPRHRAYVTVCDERYSLLDIARMVRRVLCKDVPINLATEGKGKEYSGSNKRLKKETNIIFTGMLDAIEMLSNWYIMNSDIIDREKLLYGK